MANDRFPYGSDLLDPGSWVGFPEPKSRRWHVTYDGGFSLILGYHSFIFLSLESMGIGIVNLKGLGPSAGLPLGRILRATKGLGEAAVERVDQAISGLGRGKTAHDIYTRETEQAEISSGSELLERMRGGITQAMVARTPFSFNDLSGMRGSAAGFEVELVGAASSYEIYGGTRENNNAFFGPRVVSSSGWGLVGASVGLLRGWWEVEKYFSLYHELGRASIENCLMENSAPSYAQPYQNIPDLHPYLAALPPAGCDIPPERFRAADMFRERHAP